MKDKKGEERSKELMLTLKDVSLLELLHRGSLAKSSKKETVALFLHTFITLSFRQ